MHENCIIFILVNILMMLAFLAAQHTTVCFDHSTKMFESPYREFDYEQVTL